MRQQNITTRLGSPYRKRRTLGLAYQLMARPALPVNGKEKIGVSEEESTVV